MNRSLIIACLFIAAASRLPTQPPPITRIPLVRTVDLNIGESAKVELANKAVVHVKLLDLKETRDNIRSAVREAVVKVQINNIVVLLTSANYRLPTKVGGVKIDCPITKGYRENANRNVWGLVKDARLRL